MACGQSLWPKQAVHEPTQPTMVHNEFPREVPEEYESPTDDEADVADKVEKEGEVDHQNGEQEVQGEPGDRQRSPDDHSGEGDVDLQPESPTQTEVYPIIIIVDSPRRDAERRGPTGRDPGTRPASPADDETRGQRTRDNVRDLPERHSPKLDEPASNEGKSTDGTAYGGAPVESDASTEYDLGVERRGATGSVADHCFEAWLVHVGFACGQGQWARRNKAKP